MPLDHDGAVETALRLGADAVKVIIFPGWGPDPRGRLADLAESCARWGMPLLVETIPGGWEAGPEMRTAEALAAAARSAAELGADVVKTFYTEGFRKAVGHAGVPVLILSGPGRGSGDALVATVEAGLSEGAAGPSSGARSGAILPLQRCGPA